LGGRLGFLPLPFGVGRRALRFPFQGINEVEGAGVRSATDTRPLVIRFTQTWIWRDGRWLREAFQATAEAEGSEYG